MQKRKWVLVLPVALIAGVAAAVALGQAATTGTNTAVATACATATQAARTLAVNGTDVFTIPAATAQHCATHTHVVTFTIPTVTTTVTSTTPPPPSVTCNRVASPTGNDSNPGTEASPFRTLQRLNEALTAGQTGCLRQGTYGSSNTEFDIRTSGSPGRQITIRSFPGETATLVGTLLLSHLGSWRTFSYLRISAFWPHLHTEANNPACSVPGHPPAGRGGQPWQPPYSRGVFLRGESDILEHDDIDMIAVRPGSGNVLVFNGGGTRLPSGHASGTNNIIRFNRINNSRGGCRNYAQGIYLNNGSGVQVYRNWIWRVSNGYAIQLYPNVSHARVFSNVFDQAANGFVVDTRGGGNIVEHNVFMRSEGGIHEPAGQGRCGIIRASGPGNIVRHNDCWMNPGSDTLSTSGNVAISGTISVDPVFANANWHASRNYAVAANSPLATWGLWNGR